MTKVANAKEKYDFAFYQYGSERRYESPRAIVPLVCNLLHPTSVVDVGCGTGVWLEVFQEHGVERILGLDGAHVDPDWLKIPRSSFRAANLSERFELAERFDLAVCLEVAEHLPANAAEGLVCLLVKAAPCILFSAAMPRQGGREHINEQWPEYWHTRFEGHGFQKLDLIRKEIWTERSIEYWYRQNMYLYMRKELVQQREQFERALGYADDLILIHRDILEAHFSLRPLLRRLPRAVREFTKRRFARLRRSP